MGNRTVIIETDKSQKSPKIAKNVRHSKISDMKKPGKGGC